MTRSETRGIALELRDLRHEVAGPEGREVILTLPALDLLPGSFTIITGASGAGKTTLLYLLAGLMVPVGGRVCWDGTDLVTLSERARDRWRRGNAGFVFQDFHLIAELSPLENVLLPATFSGFASGAQRSRAADLLARFGVPGRARLSLLSRGEQQRVALARALLLRPGVIFTDEPTASLDGASGSVVASLLAGLAHGEGACVLAASHDPAVIARADRVLRMERGKAVEVA